MAAILAAKRQASPAVWKTKPWTTGGLSREWSRIRLARASRRVLDATAKGYKTVGDAGPNTSISTCGRRRRRRGTTGRRSSTPKKVLRIRTLRKRASAMKQMRNVVGLQGTFLQRSLRFARARKARLSGLHVFFPRICALARIAWRGQLRRLGRLFTGS